MCRADLKPVALGHIGMAWDQGRFLLSAEILFIPDGSINERLVHV